jgi:hypothetical protein
MLRLVKEASNVAAITDLLAHHQQKHVSRKTKQRTDEVPLIPINHLHTKKQPAALRLYENTGMRETNQATLALQDREGPCKILLLGSAHWP